MDAITLLKSDHRKVDEIFQQFKHGGTPAQFQRLFDQLRQELTVHTQIEEQVFYPAVAQYPELAGLTKEAFQEQDYLLSICTFLRSLCSLISPNLDYLS